MEAQETIRCRGHPLVLGTHPTTFEVTCEEHLTENGNCIVGVGADKGCAGLSPEFKECLAHDDAVLVTRLLAGGVEAVIRIAGCRRPFTQSPDRHGLAAEHVYLRADDRDLLRSGWRLALPRALIDALKAGAEMTVTLTVTRPG